MNEWGIFGLVAVLMVAALWLMRQGYKDARMIYDAEIFECPECHQEFIVGGARGQRTEDRGQTPDPRPLTPVFCPSCRMMVTE